MDVSCEMLLHPELLSSDQLLYIIKERRLNINNIERMARNELLEIFHHYCVPYGQRKYKDTGRGKILNRNRPPSPEHVSKLQVHNTSQYRKAAHSDKSERLKPPPDLLSGHLKRIKLDIMSQPVPEVNNWKRKMSVDTTSPSTDSPPAKKDRKPISWP